MALPQLASRLLKTNTLKDSESLNKYCPLSRIPFSSKVLERPTFVQIFQSSFLFNHFQSSFRPYHFTKTALTKVVSDLFAYYGLRFHLAHLLLDLRETFDTIDICRHLENALGVSGLGSTQCGSFMKMC